MQDKFSKFGSIKEVILKRSYAFIDFEEHESAAAAVNEMNGKVFVNGEELTVEQSGRKIVLSKRTGSKHIDCSTWREKKKEGSTS